MKTRRPGFSLFELLFILVVLGMALGLMLPALRRVRLLEAHVQSQNNLKQLGLACYNYHDSKNQFPPGNDVHNFSAAAYLLPYIEQDTVYQSIDFTQDSADKASASARALKLKVFLSVDDPVDSVVEGAAPTNYLFCAGSKPDLSDNDGLFYQESTVTLVSVTDGTSNTLLAGETLKGAPVEKDMRDLRRQHVGLKKGDLKGIEDDAGVKDWKDGKKIAADRCSAWIDGRFLQGTFTGTRAINDERPDVDCGGFGGLSGLRSMSDAANVSMADGSVRSVASSVNANVWKLLAGRNDGMVIPEF